MKLVSLNTWGGKVFEPLIDFIKQQSSTTDIFCFQEIQDTTSNIKQYKNIIRANLLQEIKQILADFNVVYFPVLYGFDNEPSPIDFDLTTGVAIFSKKSINIAAQENFFIYKEENFSGLNQDFSNLPTPLQLISFSKNGQVLFIFNFHGTPFPGNKLDSERRLAQSRKILDIIKEKTGTKILVGDFNLLPQTESIKMIEADLRNLISEFNITRTRSNLSPFYKEPDFQKFADFTFVSQDVKVLNFEVPVIEISDHLPMILEFA